MATDLDGVYFATRESLPHLMKTKGSIINVSSVSGLGGDWGLSSYNAAKGAITTLRAPWRSNMAPAAFGSMLWHRASHPLRPLWISRRVPQ